MYFILSKKNYLIIMKCFFDKIRLQVSLLGSLQIRQLNQGTNKFVRITTLVITNSSKIEHFLSSTASGSASHLGGLA